MIDFNQEAPPEPRDLVTAVKDYQVWLADRSRPLVGYGFDTVKQRVIRFAIQAVSEGRVSV